MLDGYRCYLDDNNNVPVFFLTGNAVGNMGTGVATYPDTASVMSFNSAHTSSTQANAARTSSNHQLGTKVRCNCFLNCYILMGTYLPVTTFGAS